MSETAERLTAEELAEQAGVPLRTVRFYIANGLLPRAAGRGRGALYDQEHLLRLRLIRRLSEQRVPLAEQRERLAGLSADEIRALLREAEQQEAQIRQVREVSPRAYVSTLLGRARSARRPAAEPAAPPAAQSPVPAAAPSPLERPRGQPAPSMEPADTWRRFELVPGVELHVRLDVERDQRNLIERVRRAAAESPGHQT